ncbi:hypothetical protein JGK47_002937 [Vibrio metoecus]
MMIQYQKGVATLLITAILLSIALVVTLGSYKNLFYQIKRAQNEIKARQEHWLAEGGLECGYSNVKEKIIDLVSATQHIVNGCDSTVNIHKKLGNEYLVTATQGYTTLEKVILTSGMGLGSTIKTSGSIELTGSMHFVPFASGDINESDCTSIISGGAVSYVASPSGTDEHFLTVDKSESAHATAPLGVPSFICKSTHKSNLYDLNKKPIYSGVGSTKGKDILENIPNISVFMDLFSKPFNESNIASLKAEIKNDPKGVVIDSSTASYTPSGWVYRCDQKIDSAYKQGKRRFWVEGSCAISGNVFGNATQSTSNSSQLLIFNGIFYANNMSYFDGLIYQYAPSTLNPKAIWTDLFTSAANIGVTPLGFQKHNVDSGELNNFIFHADGSIILDGGLGMDTPNRTVRLNGSLIPAYNGDKAAKYLTNIKWKEGSWNAQ